MGQSLEQKKQAILDGAIGRKLNAEELVTIQKINTKAVSDNNRKLTTDEQKEVDKINKGAETEKRELTAEEIASIKEIDEKIKLKAAKPSGKKMKILVTGPLAGRFLLSANIGDEIELDQKLAEEICEAKFGKEV